MTARRYFEDLKIGDEFGGPDYELTAEEIIRFAQVYDPQHFHTDPASAHDSFFGQHVASGWQVAAIGMRLLVLGEHRFAGGMIGLGVDKIRWKRPTLPGMQIRMMSKVKDLRRSGAFPQHGIVKLHHVLSDASSGVTLSEMETTQIVLLRP